MQDRKAYLEYLEKNAKIDKPKVVAIKPTTEVKKETPKKKKQNSGCGVIALITAAAIGLTALATSWFLKNRDKNTDLGASPYTGQSINLHEVTEEKLQELTAELKADLGSYAEGLTDEELYNYVKALNDADPELNNIELEEISRILNNLGLAESINGYYGVKDNDHVENINFAEYIVNPEVSAFYAEYDELRSNFMDAMENGNKKATRTASKELYDFIVSFYNEQQTVITDAGVFNINSIKDDFTVVDLGKKIQYVLAMIECVAMEYPEDYVSYLETIDGKVPVSYEENKETIVENAINDGENYANCRGTQKTLS